MASSKLDLVGTVVPSVVGWLGIIGLHHRTQNRGAKSKHVQTNGGMKDHYSRSGDWLTIGGASSWTDISRIFVESHIISPNEVIPQTDGLMILINVPPYFQFMKRCILSERQLRTVWFRIEVYLVKTVSWESLEGVKSKATKRSRQATGFERCYLPVTLKVITLKIR